MSFKLTELTEYSPSVLWGSGMLSQLDSTGHFDPSQTYDGYKAVRSSKFHFCFVGKKPCPCTGPPASNVRRYLWSRKDRSLEKELPVSEAPTPDGTSGYSKLTGSRQRDLARWTNAGGPIPVGGSDELDSEEVEVVHNSIGHQSSTSPSHPPAKRFQSHIIPSTPRAFQPTLATNCTALLPASPSSSTIRPAFIPELRPSPIHQSRNFAIVTSQRLQPVASSSRRREQLSPLWFPAAQVFQKSNCWPIQVTREYPDTESVNQDAVARLLRRVDRNSREVIEYANNRNIPGTASEEIAAKFACYEDELINDFQRTFDHLGRDN
ncbi:hypothetical protein O181_030069 [Austropuccinia psidii MF-1]|uniref:Uncharacterized protein n=1 Tax=Austropuccinia psidii MF-1 TaxID=1389203 RepID=A0A9Q3CTD7_9BASI|nr:hypothetical protein [Austropuccinia psidii MF-1]